MIVVQLSNDPGFRLLYHIEFHPFLSSKNYFEASILFLTVAEEWRLLL